jgi:hypothetical protein
MNIQWLFRSRKTGRLNSLTYWLTAPVLAIPLYFLLAISATAILRISNSADETDWITGRPPKMFDIDKPVPQQSFLRQKKALVDAIRTGPSSEKTWPLRTAEAASSTCGTVAYSFGAPGTGTPDVHVYPECVTFALPPTTTAVGSNQLRSRSPHLELTDAERTVFRNFATYMTTVFKNSGTPNGRKTFEKNNLEIQLAHAMGIAGFETYTRPLDVPWIYVASKEGPIAAFPGTDVIASNYDPKARPWYMATFSNKTSLWCNVLDPNDRLSVTYLDVLAESSILVRTYLSQFSYGGQEFVVGIDLARRGESLGPAGISSANDSGWTMMPMPFRAGVSTGLALLLLSLVRWLSVLKSRAFYLERFGSVYGLVEAKHEARSEQGVKRTDKTSWMLKIVDRGGYEFQHLIEDVDNPTTMFTANASRSVRRGHERWKAAHLSRARWRLLGFTFESVTTAYLGRLQLVYTSAILPDAEWERFNYGPFSETAGNVFREKLRTILVQNADGCLNGQLEVPEDAEPGMILGHVPKVPDFVVQALPNSHQLISLRQRRAYVSLMSTTLQEIYAKADEVHAVILSSYFERILEQGKADFLLQGRVTHRLVAFPDEESRLALTETSRKAYRDFLDACVQPRTLKRVSSPSAIGDTQVPVYDFAVVRDSDGGRVFVAHSVSEVAIIDISSPRRTTLAFRVDGYLSWRMADVQFYSDLFDRLWKESTNMDLPGTADPVPEGTVAPRRNDSVSVLAAGQD